MVIPDKAKPFVREGRKAAGLIDLKTAELPKDKLTVNMAFLPGKRGVLVMLHARTGTCEQNSPSFPLKEVLDKMFSIMLNV